MKYSWAKEEEKLIPCKIVHRGVVRELLLRHLSAGDVDAADRAHPSPQADAAEKNVVADEAQAMNRMTFLAVLALGPEAFEAREIAAQMEELRRPGDGFSKVAIIEIAMAAYSESMLTVAMLEAAQKSVVPFESLAADETKGT